VGLKNRLRKIHQGDILSLMSLYFQMSKVMCGCCPCCTRMPSGEGKQTI